jgi:hypothetical protein
MQGNIINPRESSISEFSEDFVVNLSRIFFEE